MVRLALVGGADIFHAIAFAALLNERDEEGWKAAGHWDPGVPRLEGAQAVAIWDPDQEKAARLASLVRGVEMVPERMEDVIGHVDGVVICDDVSQEHQRRCRPFLEAGLPTFCDKPLSRDAAEAEGIVALARRHGAPFMSCSALRFARELAEMQEGLAEIGAIKTAHAVGPGELVFYGIHPCELACTVLGPGAESVHHVGDAEGHNVVRVRWADGKYLVLQVFEDIGYTFQATFFGEKGFRHVAVGDAGVFYRNMLQHVVQMVQTGEPPFPPEHTLEIIRILAGAERSRDIGEPVSI